MKPLKLLAALLAGLLALLLVAVGALYALFDAGKIKAELAATVQQKYQRTLTLDRLELSVWPNVGVRIGKLSLSEPKSTTPFLQLESARVAVAVMPLLSRRIEVKAVDVDGFQATLVKHKDGRLNIADLTVGADGTAGTSKEATPAGSAAPALNLDVSAIRVANARLVWRDEKTGSTTTLSNLDLASGRIHADAAQQTLDAESLSLAVRAQDAKANAAATVALSRVEGKGQALKIGKLALTLDAKISAADGDTAVQARLESPVALDMGAKTVALEKLAGELALANPKMPMKQLKLPLAGSAFFDGSKQKAGLELNTAFDESKIAARLGASGFDAPLPALSFDIDINQLNVDRYLPPPAPAKPEKGARGDAAKTTQSAGAEAKIDLSALKPLNLAGSIKIGSLQVKRVKLGNLNAKISAAGGRLAVAPLSLTLYEGSANGSLSVNANDNSFGIRQTLTGVSIGPLLKDAADQDLLEGKGSIGLDLGTQGATVAALKQGLAGSASLSLKDGALKGINLAQSLRDVKAKLGSAPAPQEAKAGEKTDFSELTASFRISKGVAHNDDLSMKSPFLRLTGAGDIDIGADSLNYLAKASVVGSSAGQGGKGADQLSGVTVPVRVSGPFDRLSYKLELGSLVSDNAKAKVEEKKQEVKAKVEEQVKDRLKGLLGR